MPKGASSKRRQSLQLATAALLALQRTRAGGGGGGGQVNNNHTRLRGGRFSYCYLLPSARPVPHTRLPRRAGGRRRQQCSTPHP